MPQFKSPNGGLIVAILETCPCSVDISDISEDGATVSYDGGTGKGSTMFWDDQHPIERNGSLVFICDEGERWTFDQLIKIEDDEEDDEGEGDFDCTQAVSEGWAIFSTGQRWEIEKDDESDAFTNDEEAERWVHAQASMGSAYHKAALAWIEEMNRED